MEADQFDKVGKRSIIRSGYPACLVQWRRQPGAGALQPLLPECPSKRLLRSETYWRFAAQITADDQILAKAAIDVQCIQQAYIMNGQQAALVQLAAIAQLVSVVDQVLQRQGAVGGQQGGSQAALKGAFSSHGIVYGKGKVATAILQAIVHGETPSGMGGAVACPTLPSGDALAGFLGALQVVD
jgi:hypothetical protein